MKRQKKGEALSPVTITAVLLVGGRSQRMQQDKALVEWASEPLWQRQMATLSQVGATQLAVSAVLPPTWLPPATKLFLDEHPNLGPLGALSAILSQIETTHALLLAVDLPAMTAAFLRELTAQAELGMGVIPEREGYFEGLAALYPREAHNLIPTDWQGPDLSLQSFIKNLAAQGKIWVRKTEARESSLFHNVNYPSDLHV